MSAPGKLAGRKAFVTGSGSGIGRASAIRLASDGAEVVGIDLSAESAAETADLINHAGGPKSISIAGDVGSEDVITEAIAMAVDHMGGLDLLVTAAGITLNGNTHEVPLEDWDLVLRINVTGTFLPIKHALPHLIAHGNSSIVTISSLSALLATGRSVSYDASKGGVASVTRFVATEYADRGVRANSVAPGHTDTNLVATSRQHRPDDPVWQSSGIGPRARRLMTVPMQRAAAPSEIASVVSFLSSDDASFVTGVILPVDGGWAAT